MAKAVTLSDIAERVGVSTVTVSKALSGQKGVSEEMRQRIIALAEEMGYSRVSSAKMKPVQTESYNIGVLIREMYLGKYNSFYLSMYQLLAACAVERGSFTLMEVISRDMVESNSMPKLVQERKVDGLIVLGGISQSYISYLKEHVKIPTVFLDFIGEDLGEDYVISDSFYGGYYLTKYLFSKGHQKIANVGTVGATSSITQRYLGYEMALLEHGQKVKKEWVIDDRYLESGEVDEALMVLPQDMPTAFFCNCDMTASRFAKVLEAAGYRIPEDVSIVGYDNYLLPGSYEIGITTYEIDMKGMSERSIALLEKKLRGKRVHPGVSIVTGHFVEKESVREIRT
ncbi:MAG: LacI family DNA-binding transcriptional regulator [Lachnospiraceae bacterium]|nr:LacI family DNA-binding transcriptional regulator [Lachnospiraceae bacterium]